MNVVDIEEKIQNLVSEDFNSARFILDFVKAYGAPKALIQQYDGGHLNLSDIKGAFLWRRNIHYKQAGMGQVPAIIRRLEASPATSKHKCRYILSTDGEEFSAHDLVNGNTINCHFHDISLHFHYFLPLAGIIFDKNIEENPIDIKATKRLMMFYDSILKDNPDWKIDEMRPTLNRFITQVIFCLFAEDTGIIFENIFSDTIRIYCESDHAQAQPTLINIFMAMAQPDRLVRDDLPVYAQKFPYVNGGLFCGEPQVPFFSRGSVRYILDLGAVDWNGINPDIFGSMIQAIVNEDQRGELGLHYTSVSNILKVIKPLFLNELHRQVKTHWNSKLGLETVLHRLTNIRVFDPAGGSGNFLVVAYKELRNIEIQIIQRLTEISDYSVRLSSYVKMKNFFAIEYIDFASITAKLSLWIVECQMNKLHQQAFGKLVYSLPLNEANNIYCGNALRLAWESVCPHSDEPDVETYIVGNPPYLGSVQQTSEQKLDMSLVFQGGIKNYSNLDYVSTWLWKATFYSKATDSFAFVTTNSICQGTHIQSLWSHLFQEGIVINFAYTPFKWKNSASKNAGVSVVIVGCSKTDLIKKEIYTDGRKKIVGFISPYLTSGVNVIIKKSQNPINNLPTILKGNQATDNGHLVLSRAEASSAVEHDFRINAYLKKFVGSHELIKSTYRYCLFIPDEKAGDAQKIPFIANRINLVKQFREKGSEKSDSIKLKDTPWRMRSQIWSRRMIGVPIVFSERRKYMCPIMLDEDYVISNLAFGILEPDDYVFSILSSKILLAWARTVCGQLETRIRFSNTMGWNTLPIPYLSKTDKIKLAKCAEDILLARDYYFEYTIEELYNPDNMEKDFPELWEAHQRNDVVLEVIYNNKPFKNDTERLEKLFTLYSQMQGGQI